jgi:septum formation protein
MKPIILASQSPRRKHILEQIGVPFFIVASTVEETIPPSMDPFEVPAYLASQKALQVSQQHPNEIVLGFDTLVFIDNVILGKPANTAEAKAMLMQLSGKAHEVVTGVAICQNGICVNKSQEITQVFFRTLAHKEMDDYISTGEPFDKAGAYGIQGLGARLVQKVNGCYYNVAGLPIAKTLKLLESYGENVE